MMLLIQPYFVIDPASQGRIHAPIGFHPVWAPPSRENGYEILVLEGLIPEESLEVADLDVRKNRVLMTFNALIFLLLVSSGFFVLRTRKNDRSASVHGLEE